MSRLVKLWRVLRPLTEVIAFIGAVLGLIVSWDSCRKIDDTKARVAQLEACGFLSPSIIAPQESAQTDDPVEVRGTVSGSAEGRDHCGFVYLFVSPLSLEEPRARPYLFSDTVQVRTDGTWTAVAWLKDVVDPLRKAVIEARLTADKGSYQGVRNLWLNEPPTLGVRSNAVTVTRAVERE